MATKWEKQHMADVAKLPCVMCLRIFGTINNEVQVHHIRDGVGAGQKESDFLTVPLCWEHHQGASGVHGLGVRGFYTRYKFDEKQLLADTVQMLTRIRHGDYEWMRECLT